MKTKDRFFTFFAQNILVSLLEKDKTATDMMHEFKGTYSNIFNSINFLKEKGLVESEKVKVERIVTLTKKGRFVAEHLNMAIEGAKDE